MVFALILIFAAALRLLNLGQLPPGLYLDEVLYGLDAYSIINTGKDIYGHFLPLAFQSSGYYPPLFTYLLAPLFLIFPLTAWVVRLPAALSGILTIFLTYLLAKQLFNYMPHATRHKLAALAALLLAVLPWHIHLSRVAFLGNFGILFLVLATYLFLRGHTLFSLIIFALSTHVHYSYKLLAPVLFFILFLLYRLRLNFLSYLIILITLITHLLSIRYYNALFRVNELSLADLPQIVHQYLAAFSPQFLFLTGDPYPLLNPESQGQLPWVFIPLLILGFYQLKNVSLKPTLIILSWLLLAPLPSALAGQGIHAVRNSPMIIPLILIAALGLAAVFSKTKIVSFAFIIVILFSSLSWLRFYTQTYPRLFGSLWGQPERDFVQALDPTQNLTIPDKFYVKLAYYAFVNKLDPRQLQQALVTRRIGNLYFADE